MLFITSDLRFYGRSLAAAAGLLMLGGTWARLEAAPAVRANDFLNSLGVCTHVSQGVDNPAQVATALTYTGVRNIRDDGSTNASTLQGFETIHTSSNAHVCLLPINGNIAESLNEYETLAGTGALLAVEGPNEPNNGAVTYQGQTSSGNGTFVPVADFQRDLYAAVKADAKLQNIPVFASSEAGGSEPDNVGLQFLTIPATANCLLPGGTVYADFANTHNYVCGHLSAPVDNNAWNAEDPTLNSSWDSLYVEYGDTWHEHFAGYSDPQLITLPRVTTETGWATQGSNSITEAQQGAIFLDLYLDAFKRGWSYTFIYMLRDDPVQGYWGLVHTDYTPKGSGTYLHNFTTILADAPSTVADSLNYSIPNEPATVHDLLLEKANGTYELAVWDENASGSDSVTVNLGTTYSSINLYDPTIGPTPTQTLSNVNAVPLTLSNHPMIIEIPALTVQGAVSRKTHGSAGDFDLPINVIAGTEPVPGAAPVECRVGTNLELVVTFDRNVTAANAEINLGTASLDTTTCSGNQVILDLSDVTNAQSLQIGLSDVQGEDGSVLANATMSLSVLIGDTDGNGIVSAADMRVVRDDLGTSGGDSDFSPRADCGTLGVVSARDMAIVRDNFGTSLPSSP